MQIEKGLIIIEVSPKQKEKGMNEKEVPLQDRMYLKGGKGHLDIKLFNYDNNKNLTKTETFTIKGLNDIEKIGQYFIDKIPVKIVVDDEKNVVCFQDNSKLEKFHQRIRQHAFCEEYKIQIDENWNIKISDFEKELDKIKKEKNKQR